jgi:hypothetical protein
VQSKAAPPDPPPGILPALLEAPAFRRGVDSRREDARRGLLEGAEGAPGGAREAEAGGAREEEGEGPGGEGGCEGTEEGREGPVQEAGGAEGDEELGVEGWSEGLVRQDVGEGLNPVSPCWESGSPSPAVHHSTSTRIFFFFFFF